jgi:NIMA (never in mitosis gene a)-related kinase
LFQANRSGVLDTNAQLSWQVGTPYAMAPELCHSQPYSFKSDVWALGCLFYEILTFKHAFEGSSLLNLVWKIVQDPVEPLPDHYSPEVQSLIEYVFF